MPTEMRFDDLDLRVQPARDSAISDAITYQNTCQSENCPSEICSNACCTDAC